MTGNKPRNVAASVRERLTNVAKQEGESFQYILVRYAIERLLYRLSQSSHGTHFILKGAMLFQVWRPTTHRTTRDQALPQVVACTTMRTPSGNSARSITA